MRSTDGRLSDHYDGGYEASPVTGEYDVEPFRRAFLASGMSLTDVARKAGWMRPDQPRAGQALGLHKSKIKGRRRGYRKKLCHGTAVALCEALGVDPVDVGL